MNCGCPQRDVMKEGYGSSLLADPVRIADIVATTRRRISKADFTVTLISLLKISLITSSNDFHRTS